MSRGRNRAIALLLALCLCASLLCLAPERAEAAEANTQDAIKTVSKVLCSLNYTPVVMMDLKFVTVSSSSTDCSITSAYWTDASGAQVSGSFKTGTYTLNVNYAVNTGMVFAATVAGYINNKADGVSVTVAADGKTATLRKTYEAEIWAPTVVKQPGSEKVDLGGWCSFAVSGTYVESYEWYLESADGVQRMPAANASAAWMGVTVSGENTDRLVIHRVIEEMDGWRAFCRLYSVNRVSYTDTKRASITITNVPTPAPTAVFTPVPLDVPTPSPVTSEAAELPVATLAPTQEELPVATMAPSAPRSYYYGADFGTHWRVYTDTGETSEPEPHLYVWHETRAATPEQQGEESGICSVCGQEVRRTFNYEGPVKQAVDLGIGETLGIEGFSDIQLLLLGGAAVCLLLLILSAALSPRRSRRRRK